jgi:hypothetical protein
VRHGDFRGDDLTGDTLRHIQAGPATPRTAILVAGEKHFMARAWGALGARGPGPCSIESQEPNTMSKHKHVETAAHASNAAAEASPPEATAAVAAAPAAVEAPAAHAAAPATTPAAAAANMASTLYGVGVVWAQKGIGLGKTALEGLARALDRGAKILGDLQTQIKVNTEKPAA